MLIENAPSFIPNVCWSPAGNPDWSDYERIDGTTLTSSPLRYELHKLLRHLRHGADQRVLPPAARSRLIGVQRAMVNMLDHLDPDFIHYPIAILRKPVPLPEVRMDEAGNLATQRRERSAKYSAPPPTTTSTRGGGGGVGGGASGGMAMALAATALTGVVAALVARGGAASQKM